MIDEEQIATPPAEAPVSEVENVVENVPESPETPVSQPEPTPVQNLVSIPAEKLADYRRKAAGSRDEALRLKAENERLAAELQASKSPQNVQYTQEDIVHMQNLARMAGIPLKEDLQQIQQMSYADEKNQAVSTFLERHPEYSTLGDPNSDLLWNELDTEIGTYIAPARGRDYLKLLEKAHTVLSYNPAIERERGKSLGMAQAKIQEQTTVGGVSAKAAPSNSKVSKQKQDIMAGFASVRPKAFNL